MDKYLVLDTNNNRLFRPYLIGSIIEGVQVGEYIRTNKGDFLTTEVQEMAAVETIEEQPTNSEPIEKEIKQPKQITNKTIVINSIDTYDITNKKYKKRITHLRSVLRKRTNKDLESIEYLYNEIVDLYVMACRNGLYEIEYAIKKAIKPIINSCIEIKSYNMDYINYLIQYGIL